MLINNIKIGNLYKINKEDYKRYFYDALIIPEEFIKNNTFTSLTTDKIDYWCCDLKISLKNDNIETVLTLEIVDLHLYYEIAHSLIDTNEKFIKCLLGKNIVYCDPFVLEELNL